MHQYSRNRNRILSLLTLLLFQVLLSGQVAEPKGELRLYPRATQIGIVASRTFEDGQGREVKIIYYTGGGNFEGPYREDLLREQSITQYPVRRPVVAFVLEKRDIHQFTRTNKKNC